MFVNNYGLFFPLNNLRLQVWKGHMSNIKIMSFGLLKDKETMVTELKYLSHANWGLKNSVTWFFNSES
jgi:hypothetical protein